MPTEWLTPSGELCNRGDLSIARASDLAERAAASELAYARLVECRQAPGVEVVVLAIDAEIPQRVVHDIRATEVIAFLFGAESDRLPLVVPLRVDFPTVPHLNIVEPGSPKSLCLFEETYDEIRGRLTSPLLVERTRDWLRLTARGELHAEDQPLEPLLIGAAGHLIVPHSILGERREADSPIALLVSRREDCETGIVLVAEQTTTRSVTEGAAPIAALVFEATPRTHGVITMRPRSLLELHEFLEIGGDDLLSYLRMVIAEWHQVPRALTATVMLLVVAPKTRGGNRTVEAHDLWAFFTTKTLGEMGVELGVFGRHEGKFGRLLPTDVSARGDKIALDLLNVSTTLSRDEAARLSGRDRADSRPIVAIGTGALGSQVAMNAGRIGYGRWTLVDQDILLPHNVARHALPAEAVGLGKASLVSLIANGLMDTREPVFTAIQANVLRPGVKAEALVRAFTTAELIVDMSASIVVARWLTHCADSTARRVSLFLNPRGTDLVLLAESGNRDIPLDVVEMQYYRAILQRDELAKHLESPAQRVRYGRSCRDVSVRISQEVVALHAAIGTRALRSTADNDQAGIKVWQANVDTGEVRLLEVAAESPIVYQVNGWTVIFDEGLRRRLTELRAAKLPKETGGVLLGTYDIEAQMIYIIDTIPAPADSDEHPTWFIRGSQGLPREIQLAMMATNGQAEYVGEWHSHPRGCTCQPSMDDVRLFAWLTDHMDAEALPALMLIVGDDSSMSVFVGQIEVGKLRDENRVAVIHGIV